MGFRYIGCMEVKPFGCRVKDGRLGFVCGYRDGKYKVVFLGSFLVEWHWGGECELVDLDNRMVGKVLRYLDVLKANKVDFFYWESVVKLWWFFKDKDTFLDLMELRGKFKIKRKPKSRFYMYKADGRVFIVHENFTYRRDYKK